MWDATAVFTYATASTIFLYLPLIPDFALVTRSHGRLAQIRLFGPQSGMAKDRKRNGSAEMGASVSSRR